MLNQRAPQRSATEAPDLLMASSPFQSSCSIHEFFAGGDRGHVLENVTKDLQHGFKSEQPSKSIKIYGEPGSGKSMLGLVLTHRLKNKFNVVRYDHPRVDAERLVQHLLIEFCPSQTRQLIAQLTDVDLSPASSPEPEFSDLVQAIKESAQIKPVVLMLDSPEIDPDSVTVLRQLNKLRVDGKPVLQTIVFETLIEPGRSSGTYPSSFQTTMNLTDDADLNNRSAESERCYHLRRLSLSEIHDYLRHQMLLFDYSRRDTFSREMAYFVADRTSGVLRDMNVLARRACRIAGLQNNSDITLSHLLQAGLPQKPEGREFRAITIIRSGGLRLAIFVASVLTILTTVVFTPI